MKFKGLESVKSLAIVGATGLVGEEFLTILGEHKIAIAEVKLLASEKSAGQQIEFGSRSYSVETLTESSFDKVDAAFFSVPAETTRKFVPAALKAGAIVVDDSSVYRMDPNIPLIIPEINGSILRDYAGGLVSTPNCTTTPMVLALNPLRDFGISRVVVSTYQSVSGAGRKAFEELSTQTVALLNGQAVEAEVFPHRIAFNCLPQVGAVAESGNSVEEEKMINETRKILSLPELRMAASAVRVPTFCAHGLTVNVEFQNELPAMEVIRELLDSAEGVQVLDRADSHIYPTNVEAIGSDDVFIGRLRRDRSVKNGISFWAVCDNLRKGAALNALQIIDALFTYRRMA